ncbi:MAG: tocopherol cyclase family protein [Saprospiraceae bacterium]
MFPVNSIRRLRATFQPDMFHGWGRNRKYFEGWYFKVVSTDGKYALAFIPGISFSEDGSSVHAFIQTMYGSENKAAYERFDSSAFKPSPKRFELQLGENYFSNEKMELNLPDVQGRIDFQHTTPWPKMFGAPGIMGWYSFVPFMQCFHGINSLHHQLDGTLKIKGEQVSFTGGKGYIEKDWGRSFPKAYVWMQSNHFERLDRASLMASVAHIPWMNSWFAGFISGIWLEDRLFRFATYTGAKKHLEIGEDQLSLIYTNPKTELRILAHKAPGTELVSPLQGEMTGKISESLQARLEVQLLENDRIIFEDTGHHAGLEVAGDTDCLL